MEEPHPENFEQSLYSRDTSTCAELPSSSTPENPLSETDLSLDLYVEKEFISPITGGQDKNTTIRERNQPEDPHIEKYREMRARESGLPISSSWAEIYAYEDLQERLIIANQLGWREKPELTQKFRLAGLDPYPSWRNILTDVLNIPRTASAEDILRQVQKLQKNNLKSDSI